MSTGRYSMMGKARRRMRRRSTTTIDPSRSRAACASTLDRAAPACRHPSTRPRGTGRCGTAGLVERQKPRVVEIGRDGDSLFTARGVEQLSQSDLVGVDRAMTDGPEMRHSEGRHRHVDQELQPVSSMVSSSARLAAYRKSLINVGRFEKRIRREGRPHGSGRWPASRADVRPGSADRGYRASQYRHQGVR
jgi:hypothetical protein